jgi:hypothetical protein
VLNAARTVVAHPRPNLLDAGDLRMESQRRMNLV